MAKMTHDEIGVAIARHYAREVGMVNEDEGYSPDALEEARGLAFADAIKAAGGYVRSHSNVRDPFQSDAHYIGVGRVWRRVAAIMWRQACEHDTGNREAICNMTIGEVISLYLDTDRSVWFTEDGREVAGSRAGGLADPAKECGAVSPDFRNERDRQNFG